MMGRCQGGYCQMRMVQMIEEAWPEEPSVVYERKHSELFTGPVRS